MTVVAPDRIDPATTVHPATSGSGPRWPIPVAGFIALVFAVPALYVTVRTAQLGSDLGDTLGSAMGPLGRTLLLASTVSVTAAVLGTMLAWLVERTDLPAARLWRLLLVLPLALPSFVGAAALLAAFTNTGLVSDLLGVVGLGGPRRIRGFWPTWLVLSGFTYPYVLLSVQARLASLRPSLEESARLLGRTGWQTFRSVTLPQLRSSILAGGLLVFLYSVSEFGAVQLLGYDTLTRVVYASRISDRSTSFTSAALLIVVAFVVVATERRFRAAATDERARGRARNVVALGRWRPAAVGLVGAVVTFTLVVPMLSLGVWARRGLVEGRLDLGDLVGPMLNTMLAGVVTAAVAIAVLLPLAVATVRHRSRAAAVGSVSVVNGFAVPGLVIALSLVVAALRVPGLGWLYQTFPLLVLAYVLHFGSQALGSAEDAVRAVPASIRESARLLNSDRSERLVRVDWPLMRPSLASGAGLVMLSTVKELPATLLLAPIGFDTLATDVWAAYEEGFLARVGLTSIVLVAVSAALTWLLVIRQLDRR